MTPPIVCLPGLGADHRLFAPQLEAFPSAIVPDWPPDPGAADLEALAAAIRRDLIDRGAWTPQTLLVGFSFGAQVALTMTLAAIDGAEPPPRAVALVSGLWTAGQLTPAFRRQAAAARFVPDALMRWSARSLVAPRFARACALDASQTRRLIQMARDLNAARLKRHARLAARWSVSANDLASLRDAGVRLLGVHAGRDPVIPPPKGPPAGCEIIDARAHLLTWSHADRVNDLIRRGIDP